MNSKENGISSPLEIYKESTTKKYKQDQRKVLIQFIIIFMISHIGRSIFQQEKEVHIIQDKYEIKQGYVQMELIVSSIIPEDQTTANLINSKTLQEIEGVNIIERQINQDALLKVKLEVPRNKSTWIINRPSDWKLIPYRNVISKRRRNYEIIF